MPFGWGATSVQSWLPGAGVLRRCQRATEEGLLQANRLPLRLQRRLSEASYVVLPPFQRTLRRLRFELR